MTPRSEIVLNLCPTRTCHPEGIRLAPSAVREGRGCPKDLNRWPTTTFAAADHRPLRQNKNPLNLRVGRIPLFLLCLQNRPSPLCGWNPKSKPIRVGVVLHG